MVDLGTGTFTVGVFQDAVWAAKGLQALKLAGFVPESLTILAKDGADVSALFTRVFGSTPRPSRTASDWRRAPHAVRWSTRYYRGASRDLAKLESQARCGASDFEAHDAPDF